MEETECRAFAFVPSENQTNEFKGYSTSSGVLKGIEKNITDQLQQMEERLSKMITTRLVNMEQKFVECQRSMLSDIELLFKEQTFIPKYYDGITEYRNPYAIPNLPIESVERLLGFEEDLKFNESLCRDLTSVLLDINSHCPSEYIYLCWQKIMTDQVAGHFYWKRIATNNSIINFTITKTIIMAYKEKFPLNQENFFGISQQYFQNAPNRIAKMELENAHDPTSSESLGLNGLQNIKIETEVDPLVFELPKKVECTESERILLAPLSTENLPSSEYAEVMPIKRKKTAAERVYEYRVRKRMGITIRNSNGTRKTGAERAREHRLKRNNYQLMVSEPNNKSSNSVNDDTHFINHNNSTCAYYDDKKSYEHLFPADINNPTWNCFSENNATKTSMNDVGKHWEELRPVPKKLPKSSAERSRAYRLRKKIQQAALYQLKDIPGCKSDVRTSLCDP